MTSKSAWLCVAHKQAVLAAYGGAGGDLGGRYNACGEETSYLLRDVTCTPGNDNDSKRNLKAATM